MDSHELANTLTVVYGYLHQIKKLAISQGCNEKAVEIKDMAFEGMYKLDMLNKQLTEDVINYKRRATDG